eukprot:scaffold268788_cov31-Tisochrysis_lutea.AAC.2
MPRTPAVVIAAGRLEYRPGKARSMERRQVYWQRRGGGEARRPARARHASPSPIPAAGRHSGVP